MSQPRLRLAVRLWRELLNADDLERLAAFLFLIGIGAPVLDHTIPDDLTTGLQATAASTPPGTPDHLDPVTPIRSARLFPSTTVRWESRPRSGARATVSRVVSTLTAGPDTASSTDPAGGRRRDQLRDFLRTRRARLAPADVGMAVGVRRRTPGLRREEVAVLAGVGVSWYTWLEQGRDITVSAEVLDAIARALRLSATERVHLYLLAGLNPPRTAGAPDVDVAPELRDLLDAWDPRPAMLLDRYWNVLAVNRTASAVFGFTGGDRNCLVAFFTDDRYRRIHVHWEGVAPSVVAAFRADAAHAPDDPRFARIVAAVSAASAEFTALWERHDVAGHGTAVKAVRHPDVGDLVFDKTALVVADHPDRRIELYNPRPGTDTGERLHRLAAS